MKECEILDRSKTRSPSPSPNCRPLLKQNTSRLKSKLISFELVCNFGLINLVQVCSELSARDALQSISLQPYH